MATMPSNQWKQRLACILVREQHGENPERVARHLLARGLQTFADIMRGTGLPASQLKQALLLMVQHNYVAAYTHKDDEGPRVTKPPYSVYEARIDRMVQIVRQPRFLVQISDDMGRNAELIVQLLLENGRLTLEQIQNAMAAKDLPDIAKADLPEIIRNTFMQLVQAHYVERAPPCNLPPPVRPNHPASVKVRKAKAAGSEGAAAEQGAALRTLEDLKYERERFKLPQDILLDFNAGEEEAGGGAADGPSLDDIDLSKPPPAKKQRIKAGQKKASVQGANAQLQAQLQAQQEAEAAGAMDGPREICWRVNYEEFNRRFRHQAFVQMVKDKIDSDAGLVMEAMCAASRVHETIVQEPRSCQLSVEEITSHTTRLLNERNFARKEKAQQERAAMLRERQQQREAAAAAAGGADAAADAIMGDADGDGANGEDDLEPLDYEKEELGSEIPSIIASIANDQTELLTYVGEGMGGTMYTVNYVRMIDLIRLKQLEAIAKERYGVQGMRIFRMLIMRGQLEQKQISDFAMLPAKDTRELLYRMLKGGFTLMQDIPKGNDRAPSRTFYTWRAEPTLTADKLAVELYRVAGNVLGRMKHEEAKDKELLDVLREAHETQQVAFSLTEAQRKAVMRYQKVARMMEAQLMQLDEMIALFNDY